MAQAKSKSASRKPSPTLSRDQALHFYRQMLKIRLFEEQVNQLYLGAKMPGLAHLYIGQEAVAVGVCEALRADRLRRLRSYLGEPVHRARFTTWLVSVVRNLTVDWFRHRDGRRRLGVLAEALSPLQRQVFEHVFLSRHSHVEAYELICDDE